jgi:hypothetical protein
MGAVIAITAGADSVGRIPGKPQNVVWRADGASVGAFGPGRPLRNLRRQLPEKRRSGLQYPAWLRKLE